ncbi:Ppx/GppA family phosphatase [Myxococcota bacterium]|nr:Ppx/GppA family phosphatase [Myxococcota bacterium]
MSFSRGFPDPGPPRTVATIDIGSGSVLLHVFEADAPGSRRYRVVESLCMVTGLGRGKGADGRLHPASVERTFEALAHYRRRMDQAAVGDVVCVGTSALRDAPDRGGLVDRAKAELDLDIEVIPGREEARLTWLAAHREFGDLGPLLVVDIGAGSTEYVHGEGGRIAWSRSLDLGSVRHAEAYLAGEDPPDPRSLARLRAALDEALAALPDTAPGVNVVGVAGTVTTLLAVRDGVEPWDPDQVHGRHMSREELDQVLARIDAVPLTERRRIPGMHAARADVMPSGGEILRASLARFGATGLVVSDRGIGFGALYDRWPTIRLR